MRAIAFALVALLVMASAALAAPTLSYVWDPANDPDPGLRSFTVQCTGEEINVLGKFTITGPVYQVFKDPAYNEQPNGQTSWVNDAKFVAGPPEVWVKVNDPPNPKDSYVMFGGARLPDLAGQYDSPYDYVTTETKEGATYEGVGTLNNLGYKTVEGVPVENYDNYILNPTGGATTFDLLHLVIPVGQTVTISNLTLTKYTGTPGDYNQAITFDPLSLTIYSPWDGDTDMDHDVDLTDLQGFATGWYNQPSAAWATGDFDNDGDVDLTDLQSFAIGWYGPGGGSNAALAAVPEPGTIALLVAGALCLVGYRLRKK